MKINVSIKITENIFHPFKSFSLWKKLLEIFNYEMFTICLNIHLNYL